MVRIKKIFISAGESSGDVYGARLAEAFLKASPGSIIYGMGLERMKSAGVKLLFDLRNHSVMGITEVLSSVCESYKNIKYAADFLEKNRIDALVLIDYAGFNLKLAAAARAKGIRVYYFIPPKLWAWGSFRIKGLKRDVEKIYSIFPFEKDYFSKHSIKTEYFGHPIFDIIERSKFNYAGYLREEKSGAARAKNCVLLMPGSRKAEIANQLPLMVDCANIIKNKYSKIYGGLEFVLPLAPSVDESLLKKHLKRAKFDYRLSYSDIDKYESFARALYAIVTSGTATLELALFGVPMVVLYKMALLTEIAGRLLISSKYVSLPNILAKTDIVAELVQREANEENIIYHASRALDSTERAGSIRKSLLRTADILKYDESISPSDAVASDICKLGGLIATD